MSIVRNLPNRCARATLKLLHVWVYRVVSVSEGYHLLSGTYKVIVIALEALFYQVRNILMIDEESCTCA